MGESVTQRASNNGGVGSGGERVRALMVKEDVILKLNK